MNVSERPKLSKYNLLFPLFLYSIAGQSNVIISNADKLIFKRYYLNLIIAQ